MSAPPPGDDDIAAPAQERPDPNDLARRREYLAESPERIRELSAALGKLRARDPTALHDLLRCFQELATSAASHGLSEIAARCAAASLAVAAMTHAPSPGTRADLVTLEQHVLGVAECFRLAQRRHGEHTQG